ncbi:TRAP transporter small permease [Chelativorans sp. AA-79]|uniref:TRAP transporter small permease n=1 Tax=Chelativorans sp. AA-79 TaxID=3028735 RepID=UPI0023FA474A|nr:TRAP transporter small permease [Chelativorans sp. AA-79]WEX08922.1 TRAP transporter small permease [Chelativorans sp. AA-79]
MENIERRIRAAARVVALIGFFGLLLLAAMTTLDILLRWLFNAPLHGVNDVSSVVMAIVIAACIPANLAMKQNISVEVLGSIAGVRARRLLDVVASLFTLVFIILVAWRFVPYAEGLRETGDRTWVLGWPIWPWWMGASALMIAAAIVQVLVTISDISTLLFGRTDDGSHPEPAGGDAIL